MLVGLLLTTAYLKHHSSPLTWPIHPNRGSSPHLLLLLLLSKPLPTTKARLSGGQGHLARPRGRRPARRGPGVLPVPFPQLLPRQLCVTALVELDLATVSRLGVHRLLRGNKIAGPDGVKEPPGLLVHKYEC